MVPDIYRPAARGRNTLWRKDSNLAVAQFIILNIADLQDLCTSRYGGTLTDSRIPRECVRGDDMSNILIVEGNVLGIETWKDGWINGLRSCHGRFRSRFVSER
jgi:hypothetical protein